MARTPGSRNADYGAQRQTLARKMRPVLVGEHGVRASMRQLAEAAGVSVATLRHYFKGREGALEAVMECMLQDGAPHLLGAAQPTSHDVRQSLVAFLQNLQLGWERFGVGAMHAAMFAEGLSSRALGPRFVDLMLEPLLQTGEQLIRRHVERGELADCDARHASLTLMAPIVLALFHQDSLLGAQCRPLDVGALIPSHVEHFLRAFPPAASKPRPRRLTSRRAGR